MDSDIILILRLVAEGVGVYRELSELAQRKLKGETITDADIAAARAAREAADADLDDAIAERRAEPDA